MNAALPAHKTKIVATIGPASESPEMLVRLIRAGLDVARLNFSHGSPAKHAEVIQRIRDAARETGHRVAIMADLPGPNSFEVTLSEFLWESLRAQRCSLTPSLRKRIHRN
jgi:pyruvate kinase